MTAGAAQKDEWRSDVMIEMAPYKYPVNFHSEVKTFKLSSKTPLLLFIMMNLCIESGKVKMKAIRYNIH